jgi:hypothetical protein
MWIQGLEIWKGKKGGFEMKKRLIFVAMLALAMLVVVTPALAAGSSHQNQEQENNQHQTNHQAQNQGETQNQERNQENHQDQEQNQNQLGPGAGTGMQSGSSPGIFALTGTIAGLPGGAIAVEVLSGNRFVKPSVGEELEVLVTGSTYYKLHTDEGPVPIGYGDLEVGDAVGIRGTVSGEVFTAERVIVDPLCVP